MARTCDMCRQWDYRGVLGTWTKEGKVKVWLHLGACLQSENVTQVIVEDWALHYPAGSSCKYWAGSEELLEGAGCWSPLFPARQDDVVLAASICVKELETLTVQRYREPRFRVFEKQESDQGFLGFSLSSIPSPSSGAVPW